MGYTRRRKTKQKHNTVCVGHHYTRRNTNNVNQTWAPYKQLAEKTNTKNLTNLTNDTQINSPELYFQFKLVCAVIDFTIPSWQPLFFILGLGLWCLTPLLTIFQQYRGGKLYCWRKSEYAKKTTDLPQITDKLVFDALL
jgi:hypothetical protein